jgi:hypothetical protein
MNILLALETNRNAWLWNQRASRMVHSLGGALRNAGVRNDRTSGEMTEMPIGATNGEGFSYLAKATRE